MGILPKTLHKLHKNMPTRAALALLYTGQRILCADTIAKLVLGKAFAFAKILYKYIAAEIGHEGAPLGGYSIFSFRCRVASQKSAALSRFWRSKAATKTKIAI